MSQTLHVPAGATIRFGAPAKPLSENVLGRLTKGLASISGITEAHLPLCQVMGSMPEPVHLLVVVFAGQSALQLAMPAVFELVRSSLPKDNHLDIWPIVQDDAVLDAVQQTGCCLFIARPPALR